MPRPIKCRHVCEMPRVKRFGPIDHEGNSDIVTMTVDEYETIRLIDLEGLTQEECAEQMHVARTTVQGIYLDARRKLAEMLVGGDILDIDGGQYRICNGTRQCGRGCRRPECVSRRIVSAEVEKMRIAIPVDDKDLSSTVCMSYGRCPYFAIYDDETKEYEFVENTARDSSGGAGIIASQMLIDRGVSVVLTERLGQNAADVLNVANCKIMRASSKDIRANVDAYLAGKLEPLTDIHKGFHGAHR